MITTVYPNKHGAVWLNKYLKQLGWEEGDGVEIDIVKVVEKKKVEQMPEPMIKLEVMMSVDEHNRFEKVLEFLGMTELEWTMKMVELAEDQIEKCEAGDEQMDTTPMYINMCMALPDEIRYDYRMFDFVVDPSNHLTKPAVIIHKEIRNKTTGREFTAGTYDHNWIVNPPWIRLLRQDQLQDMLSDSIREILFYNQIILDCWDSNSDKHMTMEQLWLWLVMDKKYNKVWNGKGWA